MPYLQKIEDFQLKIEYLMFAYGGSILNYIKRRSEATSTNIQFSIFNIKFQWRSEAIRLRRSRCWALVFNVKSFVIILNSFP